MFTIRSRATIALAALSVLAGCSSSSTATSSPKPSNIPKGATTRPQVGTAATHDHTTSSSARPSGGVDPNAPEVRSQGDIADTATYVAYMPPSRLYVVKFPEGWSRTGDGDVVSFTDKFNAINVDVATVTVAPSVGSVRDVELRTVASKTTNFRAGTVTQVTRTSGDAILATYEIDSAPNAVTGKTLRVAVERYEFFKAGRVVIVTLIGAVGADNVDPWKIVTNSFAWLR